MSATAQISLQDYLETEFEDRAPEFVDGELVERPMTSFQHGETLIAFGALLRGAGKEHSLFVSGEAGMRVSPDRVRIPDVAVFQGARPTSRYPEHPPLLIVEIRSPSDTLKVLRQRIREFLDWGVRHIWLADPETRELFIVTASDIRQVPALELPDYGLRITPDDVF